MNQLAVAARLGGRGYNRAIAHLAGWPRVRWYRLGAAVVAGLLLASTSGLLLPRAPEPAPPAVSAAPRLQLGLPPAAAGATPPPIRRVLAGAPLILGHRGGLERGYQNSMAAFDDAIALRLDYIETDVRHTSDGVAVLMHDPVLPRECAPYTGRPVMSLTAGQLAGVRCAGNPVPRLTDLVARLLKPDALRVGLMVEVKDVDALAIRDAVAPLGWRRVIIESFIWPALATVERSSPEVATCPLGVTPATLPAALAVTHDCIGPEQHSVTGAMIAAAHREHVGVIVWTVNDRTAMRRLGEQGVDGLITDRPREALALFRVAPARRHASATWPGRRSWSGLA